MTAPDFERLSQKHQREIAHTAATTDPNDGPTIRQHAAHLAQEVCREGMRQLAQDIERAKIGDPNGIEKIAGDEPNPEFVNRITERMVKTIYEAMAAMGKTPQN